MTQINDRFLNNHGRYENSKASFKKPHWSADNHEKISAEISTIVEISGVFDFFQIIEYQIYSPIFTILQTIFGQNTKKSNFIPPKKIVRDHPLGDAYPEHPLGYFIVQMDKSTCQTYNLKNNFLGYRGIPTVRTKLLLEEIAENYGLFILVVPQATHIFDINGCDALLHSVQKKRMRSFPAPLCTDHIVRDWKRAFDEVCHHRTIQRCFMRALRRDAAGEIDESLVPRAIRD